MNRLVKYAVLAAALTTPAFADPVSQKYTVQINHSDLDLSTEAGAKTAFARIDSAAGKACGRQPAPRLIMATQAHKTCVAVFRKKAVEAINAPVLTALHAATEPLALASR